MHRLQPPPGLVGLALAGLVLVGLALAGCANDTGAAKQLGAAFCAAAKARDETVATAMMTPELQAQIARARAFDRRFRAQRPGDEPPFADGLRLTAYPDAVASCSVEAETPLAVVVEYTPAAADGGWRDRLLLVRNAEGVLQIGDIAFASDNRVRLRNWLNEAMTE